MPKLKRGTCFFYSYHIALQNARGVGICNAASKYIFEDHNTNSAGAAYNRTGAV